MARGHRDDVLSLLLVAGFLAVDKLVRPLDVTWLALAWVVLALLFESVVPLLVGWREQRSTST